MRALLTILIFSLPAFVSADSVEIINNISASVSTGGNTIGNGEIIEGSSKSSVKVYTEVNGEVIEDFQKEVPGGENFNYEARKEFEGGKTETKVKVNIKTASSIDMSKTVFDTLRRFIKYVEYVFSFFKFK